MAEHITFTGVIMKGFNRSPRGGTVTFHGNFTKAVAQAMGWGPMPQGHTSGNLEGKLAASQCALQPTDGALKRWRVEWQATAVKSFEVVRLELEGKKGKGHRFELRFSVEFVDQTTCRYLEEFICHAGESKCTLEVAYTKAAEQASLIPDDAEATEEQRQAVLQED